MTGSGALAVALGLTILVGGCGAPLDDGAPSGGSTATAASPHLVPPAAAVASHPPRTAAPPTLPGLTPVEPVPGARARRALWAYAGQADGGRSLLLDVTVGGAPCDAVTGVKVAETPRSVTVTVYAGPVRGAACTAGIPGVIGTARVRAALSRPLGSRHLGGTG